MVTSAASRRPWAVQLERLFGQIGLQVAEFLQHPAHAGVCEWSGVFGRSSAKHVAVVGPGWGTALGEDAGSHLTRSDGPVSSEATSQLRATRMAIMTSMERCG